MQTLPFTVRDVLTRNSFKNASIVAGEKGLDRQVKWSHILEAQDFGSLINGGELILTTGVGLTNDVSLQIKYLNQLIDAEVSGLCIEIGPNYKTVPVEIINIANKHGFPIIVFHKIVKFVDITQDLHTYIINQHHEKLSLLDTMSRSFLSLSLKHNGILKILQAISEHYTSSVFFITATEGSSYYPAHSKEQNKQLLQYFSDSPLMNDEETFSLNGETYAAVPIRGLGQTWGYLLLTTSEELVDDFLYLLLDRAALAIAQISLRNRTIEERKQNLENEFVWNVLEGRQFDSHDTFSFFPIASKNMIFRVFIIRLSRQDEYFSEDNWEEIKLQRSMLIRSIFKQHIVFPAVATKRNEIAVIASFLPQDSKQKEKEKFNQIAQALYGIKKEHFHHNDQFHFGISSVFQHIDKAHIAYEEAKTAMELLQKNVSQTWFYDDLGLYRLLATLQTDELTRYIGDHLQPVLDYDKKNTKNLFETLKVYLASNASKKETAEKLFVVRQTLYHRLDRLEQLLGPTFMEPHRRLSLEVAIKAYTLLHAK